MNEMTGEVLGKLTREEKASLTSGANFWTTKSIEHAGIPSIMMTDGPHGLRKQTGGSDHLGLEASEPATCFPPAAALGSTFDPELAKRVGEAIGVESAIEDVAVVLGPGINIKRSPLCGRNFEYMSEDPVLSGLMAAGLIRGIQLQGVGASLKHFAVNNQETDRMRVSADVDERTLREIYLRGFERAVKDAKPWTVMCSYNRINGVYASEDPWLLTQVLRDQWGFEGLVVSDWGAVSDRVAGVAAGMDLQMPGGGRDTDGEIVTALNNGELDESALDDSAGRMIELVRKAQQRPKAPWALDVDAHHALAREAAARSIVLLKNDGDLLPLVPDSSVALIGEFARTPRYQGGGSSHINPTKIDSALDALSEELGDRMAFAPGFPFTGTEGTEKMRTEAADLAASRDVAVVFLGLTEEEESEGFDRDHPSLPAVQLELLDAVINANPNTVVVLSNGSVVALPFADEVPAILEGWLLGQAGGSATADILLGRSSPSGRLAETIPHRLEDTPAFGFFPGEFGHVRYGEEIFVGYRWYDHRKLDVVYPFGHGMTYTSFEYGDAKAEVRSGGDIDVTVPVTNTGERSRREVIQVYVGLEGSVVERAPRELKAFSSVDIRAGETRDVTLTVRREDLAYWDGRVGKFIVEGGEYRLEIGASSRDIRIEASVAVDGDEVRIPLSVESSIAEVVADPVAGPKLGELMGGFGASGQDDDNGDEMMDLLGSMPLERITSFPGTGVELKDIQKLIEESNAAQK